MDKGKIYKVTNSSIFNWWWECKIKIDYEDEQVRENIKHMVEFWSNWEQYLELNEGDYLKTFLQQLGRQVLYFQVQASWNLQGIINQFDNLEGWTKIDGSEGILLVDVDLNPMDSEVCDFEVEEEEVEEVE